MLLLAKTAELAHHRKGDKMHNYHVCVRVCVCARMRAYTVSCICTGAAIRSHTQRCYRHGSLCDCVICTGAELVHHRQGDMMLPFPCLRALCASRQQLQLARRTK